MKQLVGLRKNASAYQLQSLNHSLDILEYMAEQQQAVGVSEVGRAVGLSKGAVHRILANLVYRGYAEFTGDGRYRLGMRLWEVGQKLAGQSQLREVASPELRHLMETVGENVLLSAYLRGEIVYIDKAATDQAVQTYSPIGGRAPAHMVASGKALLANQPEGEIKRVLDEPLARATKNTITNPIALKQQLEQIRQQGYAINLGERREDVNGVAAVIRDSRGEAVAAVSISGPAFRFSGKAISNSVEPLKVVAESISRRLGYPGRGVNYVESKLRNPPVVAVVESVGSQDKTLPSRPRRGMRNEQLPATRYGRPRSSRG